MHLGIFAATIQESRSAATARGLLPAPGDAARQASAISI
jgi:hypothetical protein